MDLTHTATIRSNIFPVVPEGMMILLAAGSIAYTACERLLHPEPLQQLDVGFAAISVFASLINLVVAKILVTVGRNQHSITLEADGKHLMADVWTTVGIVPGIGLIALDNRFQLTLAFAEQMRMPGWEILDPVIAISVAINILWAGLRLLLRSISGLMDATLPEEELAEIVGVLEQFTASDQIAYHPLRPLCRRAPFHVKQTANRQGQVFDL